MSICTRCASRVKDWIGDDPRCAFPHGVFDEDNWNCATMCDLRELAQMHTRLNDEQRAVLIPIPDTGDFAVLGWYKRRGRTERAFRFGDGSPLRIEDAEACLKGATP